VATIALDTVDAIEIAELLEFLVELIETLGVTTLAPCDPDAAQQDRDAAFEYLAPGGMSAPRRRTLFRQVRFAFTLGDDPPPVAWTPVAETDEVDDEGETDIEALVDEGFQAAVGLAIEMLTYGTPRDKVRAVAFFRPLVDGYPSNETDEDEALAKFEELMTELRCVEPSADRGSGAEAAQPEPARDGWATSGVECPEVLVVAGRAP
jgi:hypothetical protein